MANFCAKMGGIIAVILVKICGLLRHVILTLETQNPDFRDTKTVLLKHENRTLETHPDFCKSFIQGVMQKFRFSTKVLSKYYQIDNKEESKGELFFPSFFVFFGLLIWGKNSIIGGSKKIAGVLKTPRLPNFFTKRSIPCQL